LIHKIFLKVLQNIEISLFQKQQTYSDQNNLFIIADIFCIFDSPPIEQINMLGQIYLARLNFNVIIIAEFYCNLAS